MSEIVYILTIVFVAYTIFSAVKGDKKSPSTHSAESSNTENTSDEDSADNVVEMNAKHLASADTIRNPETGETAKISNNYRFCKRWIKEVLVKEGLLDRVYKNNELTDDVNAKIQQALADLQMIKKYQV